MTGAGTEREEPELRITPLIDTVFLLLIFFIVTADTASQEYALQLNLLRRTASPAEPAAGRNVVISVTPDCRVVMGGKNIAVEEFKKMLKAQAASTGTAPAVALSGSGDASTACIVRVLDACAEAGVRNFGFVSEPKQAPAAPAE